MWGTVETQGGLSSPSHRGDRELARHIDDVGEASSATARLEALATEHPLIMEKAGWTQSGEARSRPHGHARRTRRPGQGRSISQVRLSERLERKYRQRSNMRGAAHRCLRVGLFEATITGVTTESGSKPEKDKRATRDARTRFGETIAIGTLPVSICDRGQDDFGETSCTCHSRRPCCSTVIGAGDVEDDTPWDW